ncbi:MAG: response regulator transcription factor, partial [Elusimicrobiota bacterium]|nr:response regulator transcription factor [Elusimicrobiota bacterium]
MEKQKVLIVDDEPKILKLLKSYFEAAGFDAVCADGGLQGLKLFEQNTIALILLDIMLPDFSGEEFCKKIRQVSSVPIIMVTAKVDEESIVRCLNMGADDYISKPFSPRQLIARAQAVLRRADPVQNASLISCGDLTLDIEKRVAVCKGKTIELTRGEYDILSLLMSK